MHGSQENALLAWLPNQDGEKSPSRHKLPKQVQKEHTDMSCLPHRDQKLQKKCDCDKWLVKLEVAERRQALLCLREVFFFLVSERYSVTEDLYVVLIHFQVPLCMSLLTIKHIKKKHYEEEQNLLLCTL